MGDAYRVKVRGAPAETTFSEPVSRQEMEDFWHRCSAGGRNLRPLEAKSAAGDPFKAIGSKLFQSLFSGVVRKEFDKTEARARSSGSRLRLHLRFEALELAAYPWEYLYDREDEEFLFRSGRASILRTLDVSAVPRPLFATGPLRMLVLSAGPEGLPPLCLEEEFVAIQKALACLTRAGRLVIQRMDRPTLPKISEYLQENHCHIVHFLGHGDAGALYMEDTEGAGLPIDHDLVSEFLQHEHLRLVVLNACEGARAGEESPFSGVAQRLVRRGVPAVVAMQCAVEDSMAVAFSRHFYRFLARTGRPGQALALTRRELLAEGYRNGWGIPALYMQASDGQLLAPGWCWPWKLMAAGLAAAALMAGTGSWISHQFVWNPRECPSPPGLKMKFVLIQPGMFQMGEDHGDKLNAPAHKVTITRPFCLGAYEVTQEQWKKTMNGDNPSEPKGDDLPVTRVSWNDAQRFVAKLNEKEKGGRYRLSTEAEWEFTARAGGSGEDLGTLPESGNCASGKTGKSDGFEGPAPVGSFKPNPWGLYDMQGNVFEWVADWFGPYSAEPATDPAGPVSGKDKVRRGGSWKSSPVSCRPADRSRSGPDEHHQDTGFRIVRAPIL
jgi:formylglycine-generating enzyme required for sulfatase activity